MKLSLSPLRPEGPLAWALAVLSLVLAAVALLVAYYMLRAVDYDGVGKLGLLGLMFAPQLLGVALASALLAVVSCRRRAVLAAWVFAALTALLAAMSIVPTTAQYLSARRYGTSVSVAAIVVPHLVTARAGTPVTYAMMPDGKPLLLDIWRAKGVRAGTLRPAIVKVHGGGWNHGARGNLAEWNRFFTELGYDVFDIDYRMPPRGNFRDEVGDVKCALGWVAANAARYGVDPARISVLGYSAGANLALLAAFSAGNPLLPPSCAVPHVAVRSVVNFYGPTKLKRFYETTGSKGYIESMMHPYIGGAPDRYSDRYDLLSPVRHVKPKVPPTITFQGEADRVVPAEQAELLDDAFEEHGVRHETYYFPWADHGFDAVWGSFATQTARDKVRAFLRKYG